MVYLCQNACFKHTLLMFVQEKIKELFLPFAISFKMVRQVIETFYEGTGEDLHNLEQNLHAVLYKTRRSKWGP